MDVCLYHIFFFLVFFVFCCFLLFCQRFTLLMCMFWHSAIWQYLCGIYGQHDIARDVQVCVGSGTLSPSVYQLMTKILWINFSSNFNSNGPIRSQFCTWHDSLAVMVCAKLWSDLIFICHVTGTWIFTRPGLWAHNPFVKWASGHYRNETWLTYDATFTQQMDVIHASLMSGEILCVYMDKYVFCVPEITLWY